METKKILVGLVTLVALLSVATPIIANADIVSPEKSTIAPQIEVIMQTDRIVSTTKISHMFIGYATTAWAKANNYTILAGKAYSAGTNYSYNGIGINFSVSYSRGVSTSIPVNATKQSRLGVWADVTFYKHFVNSTIRSYYYVTQSHSNTQIGPVYR